MTDERETEGKSRKERILHTRVPAVLDQELKRLAGSLRVPVSNVVRTILEDAVATIDSVGRVAGEELRDVAARLSQGRGPATRGTSRSQRAARGSSGQAEEAAPLQGVLGFQPLLLARAERCTLCGGPLPAGGEAYLGIRDGQGPRVLLGKECLPFSAVDKEEVEHG